MVKEKVILAYSGGLDTSVAITWLSKDYDMDVGEGNDLDFIHDKALKVGAIESHVIDVKDEFAEDYVLVALQGHTFYEQKYPLVSALSRPLISKKLVEIAHQTGATTIAHGCTGKGNDQVRFEVAIASLDPQIKVIAPVREWKWSREEEITYAKENGVPIPADLDSPYSVDQNLWGRANECGVLENPWNIAPEDAYDLTVAPEDAPDSPEFVEIDFKAGVPVALNGQAFKLADLILELNDLAGKHGVGRIDHVENRLVGIKSREIYEAPGAVALIEAHQALESVTLERMQRRYKRQLEQTWGELVYEAQWYSPLKKSMDAFIEHTQEYVSGDIRMVLHGGRATVNGRRSESSLYDFNLATYETGDTFDQSSSRGFIDIYGLQSKLAAARDVRFGVNMGY